MKKNLVSSYIRLIWVVYSGEVRGEVGTRSRMCYVGWVVWVHGSTAIICYSRLIKLDLRYHLMFVEINLEEHTIAELPLTNTAHPT